MEFIYCGRDTIHFLSSWQDQKEIISILDYMHTNLCGNAIGEIRLIFHYCILIVLWIWDGPVRRKLRKGDSTNVIETEFLSIIVICDAEWH